ncbi:MAG: hypothetical protein NTU53_01995 [Planctomycetota bacterium]|nr:hypothetical protein [Planctomycetota bacterium]
MPVGVKNKTAKWLGIGMAMAIPFLACGISLGYTVTFAGLGGSNGTPLTTTYTEGNFSVAATGQWFQAQLFGQPTPSIYCTSAVGSVDVKENTTGLFTFSAVDLGNAMPGGGGTDTTYVIEGFRSGLSKFSTNGSLPHGFTAIASPDSSRVLDLLRITMTKGTASYNIDNINVTTSAVPLPSAFNMALLAIPVIGAGWYHRSRRSA